MRLWVILPEDRLTDDRSYLLGYLKSVFESIEISRANRLATTLGGPKKKPDLILNLVSARSLPLLETIDRYGEEFNVPVSPLSKAAWRTEDKRTYIEDFGNVSPPTLIASSLSQVEAAVETFDGDIVVKDPFSDRGNGVERSRSHDELSVADNMLKNSICGTGELIVQPYLHGFSDGDKRIIAQRNPKNQFDIIAYIRRKPPEGEWKSNLRSGGVCMPASLNEEEREFALEVASRAGVDNVCMDIARHEGRLYYIEHNQGFGGIIDFDLEREARSVEKVGEFLLHLAKYGRHI